jgi:Mn2+/Fe2+ NRAMP family transporter
VERPYARPAGDDAVATTPERGPAGDVARKGPRSLLRVLGPGLVAGAADVDPTTVATMVVIGATTGFALCWLAVLVFPFLAVILVISARVGVVGGSDLQTLVRRRFGRRARLLLLGSILVVTIITLAADLEAGASAIALMLHTSWEPLVGPLAVLILGLLLLGTFDEIQTVLKYVLLILLAYVATALSLDVDWLTVARHTLVPNTSWGRYEISGALALLGTTLTSYVYVWHTVELAEEKPALSWLRPKEADAAVGIFFAVAIAFFILVTSGATLGAHHHPVQTAQEASRALRPLAGPAASYLFGIGLLGSALLAVPVLMGTVAYVVGAEFDWRRGLSEPVRNAPWFYAVIAFATVLGTAIAYSGVSPIRLLFAASVVGGLGTPISLAFLLLVASDRELMVNRPIGIRLELAGWTVTAMVTVVSLVYLLQVATRNL